VKRSVVKRKGAKPKLTSAMVPTVRPDRHEQTGEGLYKILGVTERATADEIKQAYRRKCQECHPDRNPGDEQAASRFKEVESAYYTLGDEVRRRRYDELGEISTPCPDQSAMEIMGGISSLLDAVVRSFIDNGQDVESNNLVKALIDAGNGSIRETEKGLAKMTKLKTQYEKAKKRIRKESKEGDFMRMGIDQNLKTVNISIEQIKKGLTSLRKTVDYLAKIGYEFDLSRGIPWGYVVNSTTFGRMPFQGY